MPEEYDHKDDDCSEVRSFKELVTHPPAIVGHDPLMTYKTKGIQANAIQPDLVPSGGEPPKSSLDQ
ncbi:unnamed protein product [Alternaria sp. RS040]